MPQSVAQTVNVEILNVNPGSVQIAESVRHSQNIAEQKESQRKSTEIVEINRGEGIEPVKDEDKKRKALLSQQKENDDKKNNSSSEEHNEKEIDTKNTQEEKNSENTQQRRKIDIKV